MEDEAMAEMLPANANPYTGTSAVPYVRDELEEQHLRALCGEIEARGRMFDAVANLCDAAADNVRKIGGDTLNAICEQIRRDIANRG